MSKQEVKEEQRQQDIAPEMKSAIRRSSAQIAARSACSPRSRHADVVVTNPTHFAVALRYAPRRARPAGRREGRRPDRPADPRDRRRARHRDRREPARSRAASTPRSRSATTSPPTLFAAVAEVLAFVYRTSAPQAVAWA